MGTWVQLLQTKHLSVHGTQKRFMPGDWVEVGKQIAMQWIADGSARIPNALRAGLLVAGSGVGMWGGAVESYERLPEIDYTELLPERMALPYHLTCLWQPGVRLSAELLAAGFQLLQTWQIAVPLWNYDELAQDVGKEAGRERTKAVVHDLRIPVYDVRLMFVRRCPETEQLMEQWTVERQSGDHDQLTFLRALYLVKPLILPLPMTWTQKDLYA